MVGEDHFQMCCLPVAVEVDFVAGSDFVRICLDHQSAVVGLADYSSLCCHQKELSQSVD